MMIDGRMHMSDELLITVHVYGRAHVGRSLVQFQERFKACMECLPADIDCIPDPSKKANSFKSESLLVLHMCQ